ncbi:MAG TPA: hypothetical protein VEQ58_03620 [Polyangiaceae bacterium]|nr:hypothetical protein [Polyangiaceae bacterium]
MTTRRLWAALLLNSLACSASGCASDRSNPAEPIATGGTTDNVAGVNDDEDDVVEDPLNLEDSYSLGTMGRNDSVTIADDRTTAVIPVRTSVDSEAKLSFTGVSGPRQAIDSIPASNSYSREVFSAHSEFLAYTRGLAPNYDGAYVDLRYSRRKPVRLPGEGNVTALDFDAAGTALYDVRERDNGARDCYYLDLSRQVAAEPVKVNGDGRVDFCSPQPLPN